MVNVLASSALDRWFELMSGQPKSMKLVFVSSPLCKNMIKEKE